METAKIPKVISNIMQTPLLRNLLITSLAVSLIFPIFSVFVIVPSFSRQLAKNTEDEAVRTASHLKNIIIKRKMELTKDSFSKEFINEIETVKEEFVLEKLKIFSKQGEIIFSTTPKDIGNKNKNDYFYNIVAKGNVYTKVVNKDTPSLEGRIVTTDVVETYVPFLSNGSFIGAFEIYYDITARKKNLDNLLALINIVLFVLASVFIIIVILILFKASKNILAREQMELALQKAYEGLENQIKERTSDLKKANEELLNEIHERREIASSLQESEEKYRTILESIEDGYYEVDIAGRFTFFNESMCKILGYSKDELTGVNNRQYMDEETAKEVFKSFNRVYKTGQPYKAIDWELIRKDGSRCYVETSVALKRHSKGQPKGFQGIARDISERKKVEKEKILLEKRLRQAQKMESIGTLAGGIAHDFNNILFPVIGHAEMLLMDTPEDSPARDGLNQIYASALRAKNLVKQILTFSRQDSTELIMMKMQPVVKEALKLIRSTIPTTIEIIQDINADCGVIKADPTQIHQIVMNLTTNAYHAMEETGGELKVSLKEMEFGTLDLINPNMAPGVYACLIVADTGVGMNKNLTDKIFDPFFTTKAIGKGTGMGLSVVHGIVTAMGGAIHVYSEPEKGTQFHVYFPIENKSFEEQNTQAKEPIQGGTEQILLVDDEEAILIMEKQILERLGYQVTSRTSSLEALEAFRANPDKFDLIITDMAMPNMPGDKLSGELIKIRPDIPVLLCTGFSQTMSEEKKASLGIQGFLLKPIIMNDLAQKVREVLDKN